MLDIKKSVEPIKVFAMKAPWASVRPPDEHISAAITPTKEMPLHSLSFQFN